MSWHFIVLVPYNCSHGCDENIFSRKCSTNLDFREHIKPTVFTVQYNKNENKHPTKFFANILEN